MSFEMDIARRYLTQKKETGFITLISIISIVGVTIGVAALILTLGILNGFENSIRDRIVDFQAHIRLETFNGKGLSDFAETEAGILELDLISSVAPFIERECLIRKRKMSDGIIVRGIEPERTNFVVNIEKLISEGEMSLGANSDGDFGIVLGQDLVTRFGYEIGDQVILSRPPLPGQAMIGGRAVERFELRGVFESGFSEFDDLFSFIDLAKAQEYFEMEGLVSGADIRMFDVKQVDIAVDSLVHMLGYPHYFRSWEDINSSLFSWMKVQRFPILIAFGMIILIASINLISTLILIVFEKKKDIGILRSIGLKRGSVLKIFFMIGLIVGMTSTVAGSALALILGWIQNNFSIISLNKDVYFIDHLPVELKSVVFLQVAVVAVILCLLATLYPAWKASSGIRPVEVIRRA